MRLYSIIFSLLICFSLANALEFNVENVNYSQQNYTYNPQKKSKKVNSAYNIFKQDLYTAVRYFLNVPYKFGGDTMQGLDCSSFTMYVYRMLGVDLPRTAAEQSEYGKLVKHHLKPGDLIFFQDTYKPGISHVAIYLGKGYMAEESSLYGKVVVVPVLQPFYIQHFAFAKRLFNY